MASIRKRGDKHSVVITKKGYLRQYKTFATQAAAKAWARRTETNKNRPITLFYCI